MMKREYSMAAGTVFLWATLPLVTKLLFRDFPSMTLLFWTSAVAFAALLAFLTATGRLRLLRQYSGKDFLQLAALGFLGNFLYSALYFSGMMLISATDACILNYLWPVVAVIFSCLLLKERLTGRKLLASVLSFAGVLLVASGGSALHLFSSLRGAAFCILAAVCYGAFNVLNRQRGGDQWVNMAVYFLVAAVLSGICVRLFHLETAPTPVQWAGILWTGVLVNAVAVVLWAIALQSSEVSSLVNFAWLTPVVTMLLSAVFLRESVSPSSVAGLFCILSGVSLQLQKSPQHQRTPGCQPV